MRLNASQGWRTSGLIAIAAVLILLLLLSPSFVKKPEVQAVTHAVLQTVTVLNEPLPPTEAYAGPNSTLKGPARALGEPGEPIRLPFHKVRSKETDLVKFNYAITLDDKNLGANRLVPDIDAPNLKNKYGLLFVQIVNGGDFYLNGHWVAGLAQSNKVERWIWYEPFVVPLPSHLLKTDGTPNVLTVSQITEKPNISISRLYFGHIDELNRIYGVVYFLCVTMANTFKALCIAVGLFLLGIWTVSPKERIYAIAGSASIFWAMMFMVFRLHHSSTDMREFWRWVGYVCQGGVFSMMTMFILSFIDQTPGRRAMSALFGFSAMPAIVYAVGGSTTERYLDLVWPPVGILIYAYALTLLVAYGWKTRSVPAGLFLIQSMCFMMLVFHDYAVQTRLVDKLSNSGLEAGWSGLLFEHIPLLFLGMPVLLVVAGYMLMAKYRDKVDELGNSHLFLEQREVELAEIHGKREVIALSEATLLERERIYQDIHDGIGSQLVKAIFSLRSNGSDSTAVVDNLQACLQDLRLVIDAQPEADVDIQTTVFAFCVTQELHLEGSGLEISYHVGLESTAYADPKVSLNVLRVLQESLSNTLKHSGATAIDIKLTLSGSNLILTITDNGNGNGHRISALQIQEQHAAYGASGNRGVTGLALRAADIGAKYTIKFTNAGTKVSLSIPVPTDVKINDD